MVKHSIVNVDVLKLQLVGVNADTFNVHIRHIETS